MKPITPNRQKNIKLRTTSHNPNIPTGRAAFIQLFSAAFYRPTRCLIIWPTLPVVEGGKDDFDWPFLVILDCLCLIKSRAVAARS